MTANDWGVWVGSIGTCITGVALSFFAYKQNSINKRQSRIDIALSYKDHYIRFMEVMRIAVTIFNDEFRNINIDEMVAILNKATATNFINLHELNWKSAIKPIYHYEFSQNVINLNSEAKLILAKNIINGNNIIFKKIEDGFEALWAIQDCFAKLEGFKFLYHINEIDQNSINYHEIEGFKTIVQEKYKIALEIYNYFFHEHKESAWHTEILNTYQQHTKVIKDFMS